MVTAAVVQIKGDLGLDGNLLRCGELLHRAAQEGAQLAVLPENFAYYGGQDLRAAGQAEQTHEGPARRFLRDMATQLNLWIVGGTVPVAASATVKPHAACFLVSPDGDEVARYNKIHLFDVDVAETGKRYRESDDYQPGEQVVVATTPFGRIGLSVCYDLRFPELYRAMATQGAEILVAPSAFTASTGKAHWELLLRARAVENQCFMLGAGIGDREHPARSTWGASAIIDPWGSVMAALDGEEGIAVARLNPDDQQRLRRNMPVLRHRRLTTT